MLCSVCCKRHSKTLNSNARAVPGERVLWLRLNEARSVQERQAQSHVSWSSLTYLCSSETISQLTWHVTLIFRPVTLALKMSSSSPHLTRTSVPAGISSFVLSWLCKNYHNKTIASVERRNVHGHYPQTLSVPRSELWVLRNRLCPRTNMGTYFPPNEGYIVIITLQIFFASGFENWGISLAYRPV